MPELFEKYREGIDRLTGLADVEEVLKGLSRLIKKTVASSWTVVYLLDREQRNFAPGRSIDLPSRYIPLFRQPPVAPDKLPLLKAILRKKKPLFVTDADRWELMLPTLRPILQGVNLLWVPMVVRNHVMGVVLVAGGKSNPLLSSREIAFIKGIVSHAVLVISHIRLFDDSLEMALDMARRLDVIFTLDEINKAISSSLSPALIIETAMEQIERIVQCDFAGILVEEKGELLVKTVHAEGIAVPPSFTSGATLVGSCLACVAFAKGKSRYVPQLSRVKRLHQIDRALAKAGIESMLAIPLVSKDKTKGVLMLGNTRAGQFVKEEAFAIAKITAQMAVALENARLYEEMRSLFINTVASLANAIDAKSPWTKGHSERVMHVSAAIAKEMGLDEAMIERVRLGGLLHDIGKIGVIEALLEKPEALSEDEFPPMRLHPEKGVAILAPIEQLKDVLPGILHHHERYDGTGYPQGLKGGEIPLEARIIAVADSFDAMVADRPYKKGFSPEEALAELHRYAGIQFDPLVVENFTRYFERMMKKGPS
jgi:HD-GYP domain-containing protein (c-di-GMP phosphodiesterase class II)